MSALIPATIPSPTQGVWYLGFFPIRAYAMCILAGIVVAVWITQRRLLDRGGRPGQALDVAAWAVPFGIVGGRLYHLITDPELYFAAGKHPLDALKVWNGGLGIWGAIALGAVGAWIGCRRQGIRFLDYADAAAPGIAVAQAFGRWGNWFNNELHGGPTTLPWGLKVYEWDQGAGRAVVDASGKPVVAGIYHPTFLYESLWCLLLALAIVLVERRLRARGTSLHRGQAFALYVMIYTVGRGVIEMMREDHANLILGLRLNVWTSVLVFLGAAVLFWRFGRTQDLAMPDGEPRLADAEPEGAGTADGAARDTGKGADVAPAGEATPAGERVSSHDPD